MQPSTISVDKDELKEAKRTSKPKQGRGTGRVCNTCGRSKRDHLDAGSFGLMCDLVLAEDRREKNKTTGVWENIPVEIDESLGVQRKSTNNRRWVHRSRVPVR